MNRAGVVHGEESDFISYHEPGVLRDPQLVAGVILLVVLSCRGIVGRCRQDGYGIKGDEATYVAMALSAAYDGDLSYERRDLERFFGLYRAGPEGIFLKRGKAAAPAASTAAAAVRPPGQTTR